MPRLFCLISCCCCYYLMFSLCLTSKWLPIVESFTLPQSFPPTPLKTSFATKRSKKTLLYQQQQQSSSSSSLLLSQENAIKKENNDRRRFDKRASDKKSVDSPCILTIRGKRYNMTAWAQAHPGGAKVLQRFHDKDATLAFDRAGHSEYAIAMLKDFQLKENNNNTTTITSSSSSSLSTPLKSTLQVQQMKQDQQQAAKTGLARWRQKLFTKEDPIGIHKYCGIFCLIHYLYRFGQVYWGGDVTMGFGTKSYAQGRVAMLCLIPHVILSLSSLIFHTVPRERVVGRPMIWSEYRIHNIIFALRSALATSLCWIDLTTRHVVRKTIILPLGCFFVLLAQILADVATDRLRTNQEESTTATMPYWPGCSLQTQRLFKHWYAYCQFIATLACMALANPCWGLSVMWPIQFASVLMTCVRKGLISARQYHIAYATSLAMPYYLGFRTMGWGPFGAVLGLGYILYQLRRRAINKYILWIPILLGRIVVGDLFLPYKW